MTPQCDRRSVLIVLPGCRVLVRAGCRLDCWMVWCRSVGVVIAVGGVCRESEIASVRL